MHFLCTYNVQSHILAYVLEYKTQIRVFTVIFSSEQVTRLPCLFWPTEEKKALTNNHAANGDLI